MIIGDLSDDDSKESYVRFEELMAPLNSPFHVIPGNHNGRTPMRAAFVDQMPTHGPLNWDTKVCDFHMVGLVSVFIPKQTAVCYINGTLGFIQYASAQSQGPSRIRSKLVTC